LSRSISPVLCWVFLSYNLMNYLAQAGFKLQSSWNSASQVARIIGMSHRCPVIFTFKDRNSFSEKYKGPINTLKKVQNL
jgi:hypothetical protein